MVKANLIIGVLLLSEVLWNMNFCSTEILVEPTLTKPLNVEIMEKEDAMFETRAHGKPVPEVEWLRGSTPFEASNNVILEQDGDTHRLILKSCEVEQTGAIRVTATNKAGRVTHEPTLIVKGIQHA